MSTAAKVLTVLTEMEDDVYVIECAALLLSHLAACPNPIEAESLYAISVPLLDASRRLRAGFRGAHAAGGGHP